MSAIFGIISSAPDPDGMRRMREHLSCRGPDASGVWNDTETGIGCCQLRTTPESQTEILPAWDATAECCITADARLDNREELITALDWTGPAAETPDSTLILEAYKKWGEACPEHLLGDFAFAIWDRRHQKLFCARDGFGVKPFYYANVAGRFAFCSCVDGLLHLDWIPRRLNELRLASHLTTFFGDTAATFYSDILRLPPAHSLCVKNGSLRLTQYWTLTAATELRLSSTAEYVEGFREQFTKAVKSRLRTAGKVGSMLSGGMDSSSISAVAGQLLGDEGRGPLTSFSAVFDAVPRSNERRYIEAAIRRGGFDACILDADQCDPFRAPPEMEGRQPEVHIAANMFLNWGLYRMARERNVRVILDGFDGDSTVSHGVSYLIELARRNQWLELTKLAPAASRACGCSASALWWSHVWHLGFAPKVPRPAMRVSRGIARRWNRCFARGTNEILEPQFTDRVRLGDYKASLRRTGLPPAATERSAHLQTLIWGVMPATLEMLDQTAGSFGIELRFPFWDRRLVEFCLSLPADLKIRSGYTRWILRAAMQGILPPEVQWRADKANIGHAFKYCLLKHGRTTLEDAAQSAGSCLKPYLSASRLQEAIRRTFHSENDRDTLFLWQAANLARWIQQTGIRP